MTQLGPQLQAWLAWIDDARPAHTNKAGWRSFQIGVLFLPTSALIAGLALLGSLVLWRPLQEPKLLSRPLARGLLLLSLWLTATMLAAGGSLEVKLRLFNWLPFFWLLLAARPYLAASESRARLGLMVIVATVPALVIGLLQALLLWSGPWSALGGLLNWDLPERFATQGAGVFPNPNFTAAWYGMVLPLAAAQALQSHQRWAANTLLTLLVIAIVITGSRTVLVGGAAALLLLAWSRYWKPMVWLGLVLGGLVGSALLLPQSHPIAKLAERFSGDLPAKLSNMAAGAGSNAAEAVASGRQPFRSELFAQAITFVHEHPWLGLAEPLVGLPAVKPPALMTHTHNVMFQLAIQHGVIAAAAIVTLVMVLVARAWYRVDRHDLMDRALLISALLAIWLHAYDIPSFDSRNNMLGWLLLSCCTSIASSNTSRKAAPPAGP